MPLSSEIGPIAQACFNRRDSVGLMRIWTEDFVYEGPGVKFQGRDRMLAQEENLWRAFPDIRCEIATFCATHDRVSLLTRMVGTHRGPLRIANGSILEATGSPVDFALSVHMTLRDGRIAHERLFYDTADLLRQLGALQPQQER
jgi:predicted ester cyclase